MNKQDSSVLQTAGLKTTKPRLAILHLLNTHHAPIDVATIESELTKCHVSADHVTIYRILDAFCETSIARRVQFQEDKFRYELTSEDHHHLVCQKCGKITEIRTCPVKTLEKNIFRKHKFMVNDHSLEFFGLCRRCQ